MRPKKCNKPILAALKDMMTKKSKPPITAISFFNLRNLCAYIFIWSMLLLVAVSSSAQTSSDRWPDYVAGDYDILPNITYARASNVELKLDLYLPKNRTRPNTTLILFHGGGWVQGQKEKNVLFLLPYLEQGWSA